MLTPPIIFTRKLRWTITPTASTLFTYITEFSDIRLIRVRARVTAAIFGYNIGDEIDLAQFHSGATGVNYVVYERSGQVRVFIGSSVQIREANLTVVNSYNPAANQLVFEVDIYGR